MAAVCRALGAAGARDAVARVGSQVAHASAPGSTQAAGNTCADGALATWQRPRHKKKAPWHGPGRRRSRPRGAGRSGGLQTACLLDGNKQANDRLLGRAAH